MILTLLSGFAGAQQVKITSAPAWVKTVTFDTKSKVGSGNGGYYYLLIDRQENFVSGQFFAHEAYQVLTVEGVQTMSDLSAVFDPAFEKLAFHKVVVHRNSEVINQLSASAIKTIQREESFDRFLYDGSITAVINLHDIRVNDIIEFSYSISGSNPVYGTDFSNTMSLDHHVPAGKIFKRIIAPKDRHLGIRYENGEVEPLKEEVVNGTSYTWEKSDVTGVMEDANVPAWYNSYQSVQVTSLSDWSKLVKILEPHYHVDARTLNELDRLVGNKWKDQKDQSKVAMQIIQFVQDEVRYLGFESGLNGYKPHAPDKILRQRFGDCKDKSLLLCSLLKLHGIEANPMLVNTSLLSHVEEKLPSMYAFDHCVVQLKVDTLTLYVDPTIASQGGTLKTISFPGYGKGLVIRPGETGFTQLPEVKGREIFEQDFFDVSTDRRDAVFSVNTIYKGFDADEQRSYLASTSLSEIQKAYLDYYTDRYPGIRMDTTLEISDDRENNILTVREQYLIPDFWKPGEGKNSVLKGDFYAQMISKYFTLKNSSARKAPYSLSYPVAAHQTISVKFSKGWAISPDNFEVSSDWYSYQNKISVVNEYLTIEHHYVTRQPEVPAEFTPRFFTDHKMIADKLYYVVTYDKSPASNDSSLWYVGGALALILGFLFLRSRR